MSDITQQIKEKLDIVEFIKSHIQLLSAGKNFKACCPFHKEKTPSFMVSPDRQTWHCFGGCNEGGDIFSFLMKYENLEFYEALQILAEKAGIDLKKSGYGASEQRQYHILHEINDAAKNFFKHNLNSDALNYCFERGLKKETIEEFELGLASAGSDQLLRHLLGLGFAATDIERAGLSFRTERGTYWDRFRGRLMFPIHNNFAKIVGFTGRILSSSQDDNIAKYVNSPETPIFNKSKILYGLHKSKEAIRDSRLAILVEGQMDFLMSYQSGIKNVAATSGTALTGDHLKLLRRLTDRLILSFDSDEAGQKAAERSIDLALANDLAVRVLILPEKDPADIAKRDPGRLKQLLTLSKTARDFYFDRYLKNNRDAYQNKQSIRLALAKIKNLSSPIDQAAWIKEAAAKTGIDERQLLLEMERLPNLTARMTRSVGQTSPEDVNRKQLIIYRIMDLQNLASDNLKVLTQQTLAQCAADLIKTADSSLWPLKASLDNSNLVGGDVEQELKDLIRQLKIIFHKEKITLLKMTIARAEKENNQIALSAALVEFDNINRQLHNFMNEKEGNQEGREDQTSQEKGDWEEEN